MKKKVGRPSKYSPDICKLVDSYLEDRTDGKEMGKLKVKLPTVDDFARYISVSRASVFLWAETYPEFSDSLEKITAEQKKRLLNSGLSGEYNSTIAKLILSSNHGMAERVDQDLTTKGERIQSITVEFIHGKSKTSNP